jgi:hypothetical protein
MNTLANHARGAGFDALVGVKDAAAGSAVLSVMGNHHLLTDAIYVFDKEQLRAACRGGGAPALRGGR